MSGWYQKELEKRKIENLPSGLKRLDKFCKEKKVNNIISFIRSIPVKEVYLAFYDTQNTSAMCTSKNGWSTDTESVMPNAEITLFYPGGAGVRLPKYTGIVEDAISNATKNSDWRKVNEFYHEVAHAVMRYVDTYWGFPGITESREESKLREEGVAELYGTFMREYSRHGDEEKALENTHKWINDEGAKMTGLPKRTPGKLSRRDYIEQANWAYHFIEKYNHENDEKLTPEDLIFSNYICPGVTTKNFETYGPENTKC